MIVRVVTAIQDAIGNCYGYRPSDHAEHSNKETKM